MTQLPQDAGGFTHSLTSEGVKWEPYTGIHTSTARLHVTGWAGPQNRCPPPMSPHPFPSSSAGNTKSIALSLVYGLASVAGSFSLARSLPIHDGCREPGGLPALGPTLRDLPQGSQQPGRELARFSQLWRKRGEKGAVPATLRLGSLLASRGFAAGHWECSGVGVKLGDS